MINVAYYCQPVALNDYLMMVTISSVMTVLAGVLLVTKR